jgi:hypothetical protein
MVSLRTVSVVTVAYSSSSSSSALSSTPIHVRARRCLRGVAGADEVLCAGSTVKLPSRGSELCAVVEAMFSYNTMFSVFAYVPFADRAESIAYNALPATWASPTGGDMWNHQYLQARARMPRAVNMLCAVDLRGVCESLRGGGGRLSIKSTRW